MKRSVKNLIILLAILTVATALLPIISMAGQNDRYLGAGKEIAFNKGDAVSTKAAELTAGKKTTEEKAMAVYSYIVTNFSYDWDLYNKVVSKQVTRYTPNPNSILPSRKGICYDIASLYAAMMRSVGVPTKMVKGNATVVGGYHAWNSVYDDATGRWISMDLTVDMCNKKKASSSWKTIGSGYTVKSEV
ncbi:transglutaminase-like domain-containing protein [Christensenellaceae bacterium OttesenSCG-928-M15]|nr:transglutaminase-like domain-containing protein [Christensenellaceae bacterium OttesenSCG-928-M15]